MMQSVSRPSGCAAMIDPITLNQAARRGFSGLDSGAALFSFAISLIFTLATGAIWWTYDVMSTYKFTQGISGDVQPVADTITRKIAEQGDVSLAAFVGGAIVVCITLLPSIVELIAPRVIHPGVQVLLNITIAFDFITDYPVAAAIVSRYAVPGGWLGGVVVTSVVTLILSLFVQVLFILGVTVMIASAMSIVGGGRSSNAGGGAVIIQQ